MSGENSGVRTCQFISKYFWFANEMERAAGKQLSQEIKSKIIHLRNYTGLTWDDIARECQCSVNSDFYDVVCEHSPCVFEIVRLCRAAFAFITYRCGSKFTEN